MMTSAKVSSILQQISSLNVAERLELRAYWEPIAVTQTSNGGQTETASEQVAQKDSAAFQWINAHGNEYSGQWLALDGDKLLAHGTNLIEVASAARAVGVQFPLLHLVEPQREHPYIHA